MRSQVSEDYEIKDVRHTKYLTKYSWSALKKSNFVTLPQNTENKNVP